jgi:chemotaxis protein MotB
MYRYRPKESEEQNDSLDRWLVSYADYVTLMFALFVVLYALAITKEESYKTVADELSKVFEKPQPANPGSEGQALLTQDKPNSNFDQYGTSLDKPLGPSLVSDAVHTPTLVNEQFGNPLVSLQAEVTKSLANLIEQGVAKIEQDDQWLLIQLNSGLLFASGSATLGRNARILLEEIAPILEQNQNLIRIRGYTDNQPIHNELFDSNWELSMARAMAVLRGFASLGISPSRLAAEGYGEFSPIADNGTDQGRFANRRVVIAISKAYLPLTPAIPVESGKDVAKQNSTAQNQTASHDKQRKDTSTSDQAVRALPVPADPNVTEEDGLRIIRLPHGGIKITAASESNSTDNNKTQD